MSDEKSNGGGGHVEDASQIGLAPSVETEITEPGFQPLTNEMLDDEDMTFEEPPKILQDSVPALLRDEEPAIARTAKPSPGDTVEEPPKRFLTSDPPPGPPGTSPGSGEKTAPMSPLPPSKLPNKRSKNPVLVPSSDRVYTPPPSRDSSWSEGDPMRPSDYSQRVDQLVSSEGESPLGQAPSASSVSDAMSAPPPEKHGGRSRSIPVSILAICMFVLGFFGTGAFIWWYTQIGDDETDGHSVDETTAQLPREGSGPTTTALPPEDQGHQSGVQQQTKRPTQAGAGPAIVRSVPPGEATRNAETLMRLGEEEVERIRPSTDVRSREDFDHALSIPLAHYDSSLEYFEQASRYDPNHLQCIKVRMASSAERLASAYETTAESPQVQALDAVRFPQELRDTAANYRNVARRHYQNARRLAVVQAECASMAAAGDRRTSSALGLQPID